MLATLSQNWWVLAARGGVAILFGLSAFIWPGLTITSLVLLFGVYALVDGVGAIISGISGRHEQERWWPMILVGLTGILAGAFTLLWPGITALSLLFCIAAWSIVTGLLEIVAAIRLRKEIEDEWWLALGGVASVLLGLLLIARPGSGALALVWLIGSYALLYGILMIVLAFRLRSMRNLVTRRPLGTL